MLLVVAPYVALARDPRVPSFCVFRDVVFQDVGFEKNSFETLTRIGFRCEVPTPAVFEGQ